MQTELSSALELLEAARGRVFTDGYSRVTRSLEYVAIRTKVGSDGQEVHVFGGWECQPPAGHGCVILGMANVSDDGPDADLHALVIERARAAIAAARSEWQNLDTLAATLGLAPANDATPGAPAVEVA